MKKTLKKYIKYLEKFINYFNLLFFIASLVVWLYLTIINLATKPFEIGILWLAFNSMYGQLSFKVGCIFLIIFNGLQSIRGLIFDYYDIKETHQHLSTITKLIKNRKK